MINWQALAQLMQQGGKSATAGAQQLFGGMPDYISQAGKPPAQALAAPQPEAKTPWLQKEGMGGLQRGELLLAGMGMLGGKNFKEGLGNASGTLYGVMGRQQEEAKKAKERESLLKAMTAGGMSAQQAEALAEFGPEVAFGQMNRADDRAFDKMVFNTQTGQWEKEFQAGRDDRKDDVTFRNRAQDYTEMDNDRNFGLSVDGFNEGRRQFDKGFELDSALGFGNLDIAGYNAETGRMGTMSEIAGREADAATKGLPKPLIGAESMARVAAGLPNAKKAVAGLRALVFDSPATNFSKAGYDPGNDWGAGLLQDLGHFPLVGGAVRGLTDPLSRMAGGADYQAFEDRYGTYEAALLPIMSGAAVTDTEALRQMRAVRIKSGDDAATKERKIQAMEMQLAGLEMAARGDIEGFMGLMDQVGELTGAGPVKRGGAAEQTGFTDADEKRLQELEAKRAGGG